MITIYHNPRCSKSRGCHNLLVESNTAVEVINYFNTPFTADKLTEIIKKLGIEPIELIRKNEAIWKSQFKGKTLTNKQLIEAMLEFPKLIERPIVVSDNKAIIARPPERVLDFIS